MIYSSIHNDKIKFYKNLNIKKFRDENGLFLVEGEHLVEEASKSGLLKEIIILDGNDYDYNVNKIYVTSNVMKTISTLDSLPSIIGVCDKNLNKVLGDKVLILDNIQDPGNLGTIIRSAVAFDIDTIIASLDTVDIFNSKVIRASQGMIFHINYIVDNLSERLKNLKENNYKILSTKVTGGKSLKSVEKMKKFAIIMGNEGNGVSPYLQDLSDELLYIDMNNNCESLNVAVATSIILYEMGFNNRIVATKVADILDEKYVAGSRKEIVNLIKRDSNIRRKIEGVLQNYPTYFSFKFEEIVYE